MPCGSPSYVNFRKIHCHWDIENTVSRIRSVHTENRGLLFRHSKVWMLSGFRDQSGSGSTTVNHCQPLSTVQRHARMLANHSKVREGLQALSVAGQSEHSLPYTGLGPRFRSFSDVYSARDPPRGGERSFWVLM